MDTEQNNGALKAALTTYLTAFKEENEDFINVLSAVADGAGRGVTVTISVLPGEDDVRLKLSFASATEGT